MQHGKKYHRPEAVDLRMLVRIHIPIRLCDLSGSVDRMLLAVLDMLDRLGQARARLVLDVQQHVIDRIGDLLLGQVANRVRLERRRSAER